MLTAEQKEEVEVTRQPELYVRRGAEEFWWKNEMDSGVFQQQIEAVFDLPSRYTLSVFKRPFEKRGRDFASLKSDLTEERLIGDSESIQKIRYQICEAASSKIPVLITGETGTGKGVIARAIHYYSEWGKSAGREEPIHLNCAEYLEEGILRSELFGSKVGAFSGAVDRAGRLEEAHGNTLFLDEVGLATPQLQGILLKAIETGEAVPVGGREEDSYKCETRLIAATDQPVFEEGSFSRAFRHRLCGMHIRVPSLVERREDIIPLLDHFRRKAKSDHELIQDFDFSFAAKEVLHSYDWPGNVRQLRYVVDLLAERSKLTANYRVGRHELENLLTSGPSSPSRTLPVNVDVIPHWLLDTSASYDEAQASYIAWYVWRVHQEVSEGRRDNEAYERTAEALECSPSSVKKRLREFYSHHRQERNND